MTSAKSTGTPAKVVVALLIGLGANAARADFFRPRFGDGYELLQLELRRDEYDQWFGVACRVHARVAACGLCRGESLDDRERAHDRRIDHLDVCDAPDAGRIAHVGAPEQRGRRQLLLCDHAV